MQEIHDRVGGFLSEFVPEVKRKFAGEHKRILLVSHAATVIALSRELLGDRKLPLRVGCCTLCEMVKKDGDAPLLGGWETTKKLADGSHMKGGAEREWGFEDIEIAEGKVGFYFMLSYTQSVDDDRSQVVEDPGIPGTENDADQAEGSQLQQLSSNL